ERIVRVLYGEQVLLCVLVLIVDAEVREPARPFRKVILGRPGERPGRTQAPIASARDRPRDRHAGGTGRHAGGRGDVVNQRPGTGAVRQSGVGISRGQVESQGRNRPVDDLEVPALALRLAEGGRELLAARRQIHVLLHLVPVDEVETRIDLQRVIQELVLAADFVAPQVVGAELPGYLVDAERV